jgi:hypothetical protein
VDHFLHHLVEEIDPQLAISDWAKSVPFWKRSLYPSYTIVMNDQSGANEWGELAASYKWIGLSLRNNWLKSKTSWNLHIILGKCVEYTSN